VNHYAEQHKVMDLWDAPRMEELNRIEDPYFYRDRLTLPKYLRYVLNADHSLRGTDGAERGSRRSR
jgi:PhoPQ-activated pathogenicity-related protein